MPVEESLYPPTGPQKKPATPEAPPTPPAGSPPASPFAYRERPITPFPASAVASRPRTSPILPILVVSLGLNGVATLVLMLVLLRPFLPAWHIIGPHGPAPITAPLHATLVYDVDDKSQMLALAKLRADASLAKRLKELDCIWRTYDKDASTVHEDHLDKYTDQTGLPSLIVQADGKGEPVLATKAPTESAEVVAAIRKLRGQTDEPKDR